MKNINFIRNFIIFGMNENLEVTSMNDLYGNKVKNFNKNTKYQFSYIKFQNHYIKSLHIEELKYRIFNIAKYLYNENKIRRIDIKYIQNFLGECIEFAL